MIRFGSAKEDITPAHPLEQKLANVSYHILSALSLIFSLSVQHAASQEEMRMQVLRNSQGRHMPLMLQMERKIVSKVSKPVEVHILCVCVCV